jgi:predicted nucleic acid-binding protein
LTERDDAIDLLARHCDTEYNLISSTRTILDLAIDLTQRYRLRGYDAMQLATALTVEAVLAATGQTGLMFVAADQDLVAAANAEGLSSDDPHLHP